MATFQKKRSPARWPGVMRKLANWAQCNHSLLEWLPVLVFAAVVAWGLAR